MEDLPFFIYAVTNDDDDEIQFMISRVHGLKKSPITANIGAPDDAVADSQGSFFSFDNIDETLFDTNPCLMIGSFRMQMSSSNDWTVQTLDEGDGIGVFQYERDFIFPLGHQGASSGTYILPNSNTAPVFTDNSFFWNVMPGSMVTIYFRMDGDGGTDGSGNVVFYLSLPCNPLPTDQISFGSFIRDSAGGGSTSGVCAANTVFPKACFFRRFDSTNVPLLADYSNGGRCHQGSGLYRIDPA